MILNNIDIWQFAVPFRQHHEMNKANKKEPERPYPKINAFVFLKFFWSYVWHVWVLKF